MALYIVILPAVVGMIIIERQLNNSSRKVKRFPVRSDKYMLTRRDKHYHI